MLIHTEVELRPMVRDNLCNFVFQIQPHQTVLYQTAMSVVAITAHNALLASLTRCITAVSDVI